MTNWKGITEGTTLPDGLKVVPVVGVTFVPAYPDNILGLKTGTQVSLVRNAKNPYDGNAVEVRLDGEMLGHLPKDIAAKVAPILDSGATYAAASIYTVRISPENPRNPGLSILLGDYGD